MPKKKKKKNECVANKIRKKAPFVIQNCRQPVAPAQQQQQPSPNSFNLQHPPASPHAMQCRVHHRLPLPWLLLLPSQTAFLLCRTDKLADGHGWRVGLVGAAAAAATADWHL